MKHLTLRSLFLLLLSLFMIACGSATSRVEPLSRQTTAEKPQAIGATLTEVELAPSAQVMPQSQTVPVVHENSPTAAITGLEASLMSVYEEANPAVVSVLLPSGGAGSGFVYSQDGHIVTNNHVVSGLSAVEVVFSDGERRRGQVVGTDLDSDLAVVKVAELPSGINALPLAPTGVKVGQFVLAIGTPFGENGSMSFGIVSGIGRSLTSQRELVAGSNYSLPQVIQTDAAINPGNSGGPLLNLNGEVVGVNAAIATTATSATLANSGVGFSIPVAAVRQIAPSLIENGQYNYPYMGIGFDDQVSLDEQSVYGLRQTQGAYILRITPNGPAAKAGLQAANSNTARGGDLIIALNGQSVNNFSDLNSYLIFNTRVGQSIRVTVLRNGQRLTIPLTLGARP